MIDNDVFERTSGGGNSGGGGGGGGGGKSGGTSSSGGSSGGSKGGNSSGSSGGGSKDDTTGGAIGGSSGDLMGGNGSRTTVKTRTELSKMPPVKVVQPDGVAIVFNMQDFCYLPNAHTLNAAVYAQCLQRADKNDDKDAGHWLYAVIVVVIVIVVVALAVKLFRRP